MLTAKEAAAILGIPVRSFYDLGLECYRYGPRLTRWKRSTVEEHRERCRSTSTSPSSDGDGPISDASLAVAVSAAPSFSPQAGRAPRRKRSIRRKQRARMHLQLVSSAPSR